MKLKKYIKFYPKQYKFIFKLKILDLLCYIFPLQKKALCYIFQEKHFDINVFIEHLNNSQSLHNPSYSMWYLYERKKFKNIDKYMAKIINDNMSKFYHYTFIFMISRFFYTHQLRMENILNTKNTEHENTSIDDIVCSFIYNNLFSEKKFKSYSDFNQCLSAILINIYNAPKNKADMLVETINKYFSTYKINKYLFITICSSTSLHTIQEFLITLFSTTKIKNAKSFYDTFKDFIFIEPIDFFLSLYVNYSFLKYINTFIEKTIDYLTLDELLFLCYYHKRTPAHINELEELNEKIKNEKLNQVIHHIKLLQGFNL